MAAYHDSSCLINTPRHNSIWLCEYSTNAMAARWIDTAFFVPKLRTHIAERTLITAGYVPDGSCLFSGGFSRDFVAMVRDLGLTN